jgi:hypothetical protein
MNLFTRIVCFVLLIGALILVAFKGSAHSQVSDGVRAAAERISGDRFVESAITAKGVRIYSAVPVTSEMKSAVDKGLSDLFTIAKSRKYRYRRTLRYSDYTVFIARPDRVKGQNGEYSPDIAVGAAQYAGTKYDKGGYVYASGMVLSPSSNAFLLADHVKDFERVSRVVRFEGEHIVLYHNDRDEYFRTRDHSKGGGHPILTP